MPPTPLQQFVFLHAHYNMVRIGLGLYGIYPSDAARKVMESGTRSGVTSRITSIQEFAPGDTLGYNRTFTAQRLTKVGIVPFGYDDGLPWRLSDSGQVLVEGRPRRSWAASAWTRCRLT